MLYVYGRKKCLPNIILYLSLVNISILAGNLVESPKETQIKQNFGSSEFENPDCKYKISFDVY